VPPGGGSVGDCSTSTAKDVFTLTVKGADASFYRSNDALLTVRIEWDPTTTTATQDLALEIRKNGQQLASSDGGTSSESVALQNPADGTYKVITCDFAVAAPQDYSGKVSLTSTPKEAETLPAPSDSRNLRFMPIVTVDPQRDVAEPSLRIDKAGNIYECGPFGSSRAPGGSHRPGRRGRLRDFCRPAEERLGQPYPLLHRPGVAGQLFDR
jgi:hypothetical protein